MISRRNIIVFLSLLAIFAGLFLLLVPKKAESQMPRVILDGKTFSVEVADTPELQGKGLSGHSLLLGDQGMLFVFQKPDNYGFWMKDMMFPLDIIWFDQNFQVIHMERALMPSTYPEVFYPGSPALYVLEVKSGTSEAINLHLGDTAKLLQK